MTEDKELYEHRKFDEERFKKLDKTFRRFCRQLYMEYRSEQHDLGNYNDVMSFKEYQTKYADYLQKKYVQEVADE